MLAYLIEADAQGAKTARMEQRTTPQAKELIEQAASVLGINASEFMVAAAAKMARETLRSYEQTVLSAPAHVAFMKALDTTEPSATLVNLMKIHADVSATR